MWFPAHYVDFTGSYVGVESTHFTLTRRALSFFCVKRINRMVGLNSPSMLFNANGNKDRPTLIHTVTLSLN